MPKTLIIIRCVKFVTYEMKIQAICIFFTDGLQSALFLMSMQTSVFCVSLCMNLYTYHIQTPTYTDSHGKQPYFSSKQDGHSDSAPARCTLTIETG